MLKEQNKICVVTGGASGIGLSISQLLIKKNYRVAILDIATDNANKLFNKEIQEKKVLTLKTDISKFIEVNDSFNTIGNDFGSVDILINNAGINFSCKFVDESEENWDKVININLKSVYLCCKAAIPTMIGKRFGRIVNMSSISGLKPSVFSSSAYCASKAGIIGFSRCLASQMAKYNIRVNCVAPGVIETPMVKDLVSDELKNDFKKSTPMGRLGSPDDIANTVYFLISDSSDFITGETISVNGGLFMP